MIHFKLSIFLRIVTTDTYMLLFYSKLNQLVHVECTVTCYIECVTGGLVVDEPLLWGLFCKHVELALELTLENKTFCYVD